LTSHPQANGFFRPAQYPEPTLLKEGALAGKSDRIHIASDGPDSPGNETLQNYIKSLGPPNSYRVCAKAGIIVQASESSVGRAEHDRR
jgi:hypothetical protein